MSPSERSYESDGAAQRREQRVLNEKVGDRLVQRSWSQRLKWHPRTFGGRKRARAEA
jgi:hypothetical protein